MVYQLLSNAICRSTYCPFFGHRISLKDTFKALDKLGKIGSIGFVVSITLVMALYAGQKLDGWFDTGSFFTIFLMFAALIGLAVKFYQMVSNLTSSKDKQDHEDNTTS